jgi:hypothetical protein
MSRILQWLRQLGLGAGILLLLVYGIFCAYSLPRSMLVHVTGTEVTRRDAETSDGKIRSLDVRYVMAEGLDGSPHMFRNEDTGFGWPPYFKFDEGDIAAQANNLATDHRQAVVLAKYYGFRIRMLSMFPNILSMREVPPDYRPIPWFTIAFVVAHVVLVAYGWIALRSFRKDIPAD